MTEPDPLTVADVREMLRELYVPPASSDVHEPVQLIFEEHGTPADVCWGCSTLETGVLVPVSACKPALRKFDDQGGPTSFLRLVKDEDEDEE